MINTDRAKMTEGMLSDHEILWLATQAAQCDTVLELGAYKGRSTTALAENVRGHVVTVDLNVQPDLRKNLQDLVAANRVRIIEAPSSRVLEVVGSEKFDMIFIDTDHTYETTKLEIELCLQLLKPDGLLCGHDCRHPHYPGVEKAVLELLPESHLPSGPVPVLVESWSESIWWVRIP
jgi:predicted O-methyltransferase YrrM